MDTSIIDFEKGLTSNESTPDKKRKYKVSKWAIDHVPGDTIQVMRGLMELSDSDPASYLVPDLNNISVFVATVNASAALIAGIPAMLGGPAASPLSST